MTDSELAEQLEQAVVLVGCIVVALRAHARDGCNQQVEPGTLKAPVIIDGKINGTLRLNCDELAWSS